MNNQAFSKIWIIIIFLAAITGGILAWQYLKTQKEEVKAPEEIAKDETADWKTYTNMLWGFEIKYPKDFYLFTERLNMVSISSEPDAWAQDISPHQKVIIDIYRIPNYKNRSLDKFVSKSIYLSKQEGEKILVNEEMAFRKVNTEFPGIFTYFVRDDNYYYVLRGASGTSDYFNQYYNLIETIENTFKFIEKEEVLEPTGVEPSEKLGWWVYKNVRYKYTIEFPDEIAIEDFEHVLSGRLSGSSRIINFYLESHPGIPNLRIKIPLTYDPETESLSRDEFIEQFISIKPKYESINAEDIFNQMLSTFRFLE